MPERRVADPILLRVIGGHFRAIAKEIAATLQRTGYSQLARESEDLGAGIFDRHGRELAESQSTPLLNGAMRGMIPGFLERLEGKIEDGDIIFHNHPYKGAVHAPDICVATPVFWEGELVAWSADTCHLIDIGGAYPGINVDVIDLWAEGRIYDSVRMYAAGVRNEELWQHMLDNTRTGTANRGDLEAMISACLVGKRRFHALLEKYGVETVLAAAEDWMDYSEYMLRSEIAKIPDGEYEAPVGWLDDDGRNRGVPLKVCVKVIVDGSNLTVDLTGSNPEVETGFNAPYLGTTCSTAYFIARSVFLDEAIVEEDIPQNEGCYRPIEVVCPKGTIFNPNFPRATFARFCPVQRIADGFVLALADAAPDKTIAGSAAHTYFVSYSGWSDETQEYWTYIEINEGSYGGRCGSDGMDAVDTLMANTMNTPTEDLENRFPIRVDRYELREAVPAAGRWRGGLGPVRENRFLVDTMVSCEGDRCYDPPRGVHGGSDGRPGVLTHIAADGTETILPSKFSGLRVGAGDVIRFESPLGGGYGPPLERDPGATLADVRDGYLTADDARKQYGVALAAGGLAVDAEQTASLRHGGQDTT
jgi:N-methylhydantoinase B/oxoprolinase/acetone carboxylase alpha subunit